MQRFKQFLSNESGATAIEYGLIAGLISVVIIASVTLVGDELVNLFTKVTSGLQTAP